MPGRTLVSQRDGRTQTVLERRRRALGLSTRELGRRVGTSHVTIVKLERGKRMGAREPLRRALERVLGVPFDVLLWRVQDGEERGS